MTANTFADYFGNIAFAARSWTGDNIAGGLYDEPQTIEQLRAKAKDIARAIDKTAKYLNMGCSDKAIAQHNKNADAMAKEMAKDWGMFRCKECGKYGFEESCEHCSVKVETVKA